ncbi:hypothetical protein EXIGLDRAFT_760586 [Exidia glandulosa HHB12029]|uniref:Uncharacterized protein n=1 Tax=Exidia glandulosa HHB12029 TaxID=1314781 RepID=A0A166BJK9_EXIGL|nr:hypothetical protein EXIGLDRAFT_760586 [Exidia glandulosa HHB12029]
MLETLNKRLAAMPPSDERKRDMIVELCLTVPVRLPHLVPQRYLMQPLVPSLQGPAELLVCIDPPLIPVLPTLIRGLNADLKLRPSSHLHSHTTVHILGKLGGKNRLLLRDDPMIDYRAIREAEYEAMYRTTLNALFEALTVEDSKEKLMEYLGCFARRISYMEVLATPSGGRARLAPHYNDILERSHGDRPRRSPILAAVDVATKLVDFVASDILALDQAANGKKLNQEELVFMLSQTRAASNNQLRENRRTMSKSLADSTYFVKSLQDTSWNESGFFELESVVSWALALRTSS